MSAGTPSSEVHVANGTAPRPGDSSTSTTGGRWGSDDAGRRASPRTAPPTPPKYAGIASSYRLSGLDRLAQRQRQFEADGPRPLAVPTPPTVPVLPQQQTTTASMAPSSVTAALQSKRELFFKNEIQSPSSQGSVAPPPVPSSNGTPATSRPSPTPALPSVGSSVAPPPAPPSTAASARDGPRPTQLSGSEGKSIAGERQPRTSTTTAPTNTTSSSTSGPTVAHKELDGYVGFANLPNQVYRKAVKKGFDFTLMVVGESGLGKSTLINSMFLADIYSNDYPGPSHRVKKTVQVETTRVLLRENGVNLTLTVVDTPGFGDAVDNSNCWQPVIDYVESKYEEFLNAESRVGRKPGWGGGGFDGRVHCCLYFVSPSGHGLKPLDAEFMRRLHDRVNVVPVIAKADTLTPEECTHFKKQIISEIAQHKIKIYEFPSGGDPGDDDEADVKRLRDRVPFAVVGSNAVVELEGGRKVRGRRYPWGIAEVENLEHCDFVALRDMLIRTHLQDLKDVTNNVHYENYRCRKLAGLGTDGKPSRVSNRNPLAQMEEEKREHELKMKKMEAEMEQVFEMKVREKKQKLKDSEADLQRRHEAMRKALEAQQQELEERRRQFEKERQSWEQSNGVTLDELRRRSLEANSKEAVDGKEKKNKKKGLF